MAIRLNDAGLLSDQVAELPHVGRRDRRRHFAEHRANLREVSKVVLARALTALRELNRLQVLMTYFRTNADVPDTDSPRPAEVGR